ncbi:MAG: hypothetical protein QW734_07660 [Candidatus Bathyarchaeia archaeon]
MSAETWCTACKNSSREVPEELRMTAEQLKTIYPLVVYCPLKKTLIVANPSSSAQIVDMTKECKNYKHARAETK